MCYFKNIAKYDYLRIQTILNSNLQKRDLFYDLTKNLNLTIFPLSKT